MAKTQLYCSFCWKDEAHVAKLVAGPGVYICDACTNLALEIMQGSGATVTPDWDGMPDGELLGSLAPGAASIRAIDATIQAQVDRLRQRGVSWARIGEALGVSRQAAWERFSGQE